MFKFFSKSSDNSFQTQANETFYSQKMRELTDQNVRKIDNIYDMVNKFLENAQKTSTVQPNLEDNQPAPKKIS